MSGYAMPDADGAHIDIVALLGTRSRCVVQQRNLDLNGWLGHGIDAWVWATVACLKTLLLSGTRQINTLITACGDLSKFFLYLTEERSVPRVATPAEFSPLHVQKFIGWLQRRAQEVNWAAGTPRTVYSRVKLVLEEMLAQGFIPGEPARFFKYGVLPWHAGESRQTSLSDAEQERLARAIKTDLAANYHGRLKLIPRDVQALRLLVVAHRQGLNPTPLLELRRDALLPGVLPGTVRIRTQKYRSRRVSAGLGRAAPPSDEEMTLSLAEGAVLQQAISSTASLAAEAPAELRQRVWLYRAIGCGRSTKGAVISLSHNGMSMAIRALIARHGLLGDDGKPLRLNFSRLRKSSFDRAMRVTDGDLTLTANLLGNTPQVAAAHYATMNDARKAEAAGFMNGEYTELVRSGPVTEGHGHRRPLQVITIKPLTAADDAAPGTQTANTPVSRCTDTLNGEHAPHDGRNHCERYVMCLFCSSFAIVGTVEELWRLFSFQAFARVELEFLDATLGPQRTSDALMEDLRDRYRLAIPFIDDFTKRQFPAGSVRQAREKANAGLHPFWTHQIAMSDRARARLSEWKRHSPIQAPDMVPGADHDA
jgi:hypothetical protein